MSSRRDNDFVLAKSLFYKRDFPGAYAIYRRLYDRLPFRVTMEHAESIAYFSRTLLELGKDYELKFYLNEIEALFQKQNSLELGYQLAAIRATGPDWVLDYARAKKLLEWIIRTSSEPRFVARAKMLLSYIFDCETEDIASCRKLIYSIQPVGDEEIDTFVEIWKAKILRDEKKYNEAEKYLIGLQKQVSFEANWYAYFSIQNILAILYLRTGDFKRSKEIHDSLRRLFIGKKMYVVLRALRVLENEICKRSEQGRCNVPKKAGAITISKLLLIFCLSWLDAHGITCRGGDGPTPFINVTETLSKEFETIPTKGEVLDFIHWPMRNAVVYRNNRGDLRTVFYRKKKDKYVASLKTALSPLIDPAERYVLTNKANWYINAQDKKPSWGQFHVSEPVKHLFWHTSLLGMNNLFSFSNVETSDDPTTQVIKILKFTTGITLPEKCNLATEPGTRFRLGNGHRYPYVFLYKSFQSGEGQYVSFYRVKIDSLFSSCQVEELQSYTAPIPGKITNVHSFANDGTFAVISKSDTYELNWVSSFSQNLTCDFGESEPFVLNEKHPIVAGIGDKALMLVFPESKSYATVLPSETEGSLLKKDIVLSQDGATLFMNVKRSQRGKELLYYNFKGVPSGTKAPKNEEAGKEY